MATVGTPGHSTGPQAQRGDQSRRVSRELGLTTWIVLLLLTILFTIATAGLGAFAIGIVVCVGIVMAVLGAVRRS